MNQPELERWIAEWLDGRISSEDSERLQQLLRESQDARKLFLGYARVDATIRMMAKDEFLAEQPQPAKPNATTFQFMNHSKWFWIEHLGVAALLIICVGLLVSSRNKPPSSIDPSIISVAEFAFISNDAQFSHNHLLPRSVGSHLGKGWIELQSGVVHVVFRSGARVELVGPASLGLDSPMRSYLRYGKVDVYAPESARDFVVASGSMEVVDLGTRFEMEVDGTSGESRVEVIEGLVDLHLGNDGTHPHIQSLEAGWKAQVNSFGEIVSLDSEIKDASSIAPKTGLFARWKLDSVRDDGVVVDDGDLELNGKYIGTLESAERPGVDRGAIDFGLKRYIDISSYRQTLGNLNSFTISAWVRNPTDDASVIFSFSDGSPENRVQFNLEKTRIIYGWESGASEWDCVPGPVDGWDLDRWYHVAVSVSAGRVWIYRDGKLIGSSRTGAFLGTRPLSPVQISGATHSAIGFLKKGRQKTRSDPRWFGGQMDDVQIYDTALGTHAIEHLYEHPGATWANDDP